MIKKFLLSIALVSALGVVGNPVQAGANEPTADFSIVNGRPARGLSFAEVVTVEAAIPGTQGLFCGGTILNDRWILTAAHCFPRKNNLDVKVFSHTRYSLAKNLLVYPFRHEVKRVYEHPQYRKFNIRDTYDIALVELNTPISSAKPIDDKTKKEFERFSDVDLEVPTVKLVEGGTPLQRTGRGLVAGRGTTGFKINIEDGKRVGELTGDYTVIRSAFVPFRSGCFPGAMLCAEDPIDISKLGHLSLDERHHPTNHRNPASCQGDSGGPLYTVDSEGRRTQVGLVSHSLANHDVNTFWEGDLCGRVSTNYTSISYLRPWIDAVMKGNLGPNDPVPDPPLTVPGEDHSAPPFKPNPTPPSETVPVPPVAPPPAEKPSESQPVPPVQTPPAQPNQPPAQPEVPGQPEVSPAPPASPAPTPKPPAIEIRPEPSEPLVPKRPDDPTTLAALPQPSMGEVRWPVAPAATTSGSDLAVGINRLRSGFAKLFDFAPASTDKKVALLASEAKMADALASGVLQQQASLYLTDPNKLEPLVLNEMKAAGVTEVVLLGGEQALSKVVEDTLKANGLTTKRIAGQDRTQTAIAVANAAKEFGASKTEDRYVARAFGSQGDETRSWADSIALGGLAAQTGKPVLLSASDTLSPSVAGQVKRGTSTTLVGGPAALSAAVAAGLQESTGVVPKRIAGQNRADTAAKIARTFTNPTRAIVIDGQHADAWQLGFSLAGLSHDLNAPILLAYGTTVPEETKQAIKDLGIQHTICIGEDAMCKAVNK